MPNEPEKLRMKHIQDVVADFQEEVFKRIQNDYEEIDEETFQHDVDEYYNEELDERIAYLYDEDVHDLIDEYGGFQKALQLYIDTFGAVKDAPIRAMVYNIINDGGHDRITMEAYKEWCESQ